MLETKEGRPAEPLPVSDYGGGLNNLQDLKDGGSGFLSAGT